MAFPADSLGIMPYMNLRERFVPNLANPQLAIQQWRNGTASFPINTDILFRWVEDGLRPVVTAGIHSYCFNIYANGQYGTDNTYVNHYPWVHITPALPNVANLNNIRQYWLLQNFGNIYTVVNRSELLELSSGTHPTLGGLDYTTVSTLANVGIDPGKFNWVTGNSQFRFHSYAYVSSDNTWWVYTRYYTQHEGWIRVIPKVSAGPTTAFNGTACTIYTATVPSSDLPKYSGRTIRENDYYELCFDINSQHASYNDQNNEKVYLFDAILRILPAGQPIYKQFPERTELNSRVAGEKALFEDEFLTASQIEAGTNITLKWRTIAGVLTGYTTDPTKGGNLVIEAAGGGGGATRHQGALYPFSNANIYYDETTGIIRFQDEKQDYLDTDVGYMTHLPIKFELSHDVPNDVGIVRAHAINNNLHLSVTQLNTVNTYPMQTANQFTDYTVNHIRLVDTPNLTWNVFGDTMPTLMPGNTTAVRQGVIITPQLNGLYTRWNVIGGNQRDPLGNHPRLAVNNDQNVKFRGIFPVGVKVLADSDIINGTPVGTVRVEISRPLTLESNGSIVGNNETLEIDFKSNLQLGRSVINLNGTRDHDNYPVISNGDVRGVLRTYDESPALPSPYAIEGSTGQKSVKSYYPRAHGMYSAQWLADYNVNDAYRTLGFRNGVYYNTLPVGFYGYGTIVNGKPTPYPNTELNIITEDNGRWNRNIRFQRASGQNYSVTDYLALSPMKEGLYQVSCTVQGIMGINSPYGELYPIIQPAVHLHLVTNEDISTAAVIGSLENRTFQSLDILSFNDYVTYTTPLNNENYKTAYQSRPWSLQGSGQFWIRGPETLHAVLTYNPGLGESRFFFQVCYIKFDCSMVATAHDMWAGMQTIDVDGDPTTYKYAPQRWHDMNFY